MHEGGTVTCKLFSWFWPAAILSHTGASIVVQRHSCRMLQACHWNMGCMLYSQPLERALCLPSLFLGNSMHSRFVFFVHDGTRRLFSMHASVQCN